jgi:hypothetical protein
MLQSGSRNHNRCAPFDRWLDFCATIGVTAPTHVIDILRFRFPATTVWTNGNAKGAQAPVS